MAASKKQIASNRRNAKKSTGPISAEGKAVASRNAIKHGLHACDIILKSPHLNEDSAQYEQLVDSLIDEFKPKGILQEHLVLKIANALWRYRRVINAETARINRQLEDTANNIERGHYVSILDDPDDLDLDESFQGQNRFWFCRLLLAEPLRGFRPTREDYKRRLDAGSRSGMTARSRHDSTCARSARNPFMGVSTANSPAPSNCCTSCNTRISPTRHLTPPEKYFFRKTNPFWSRPSTPRLCHNSVSRGLAHAEGMGVTLRFLLSRCGNVVF